jgi:Domain of unknown function (DUF4407)
MTESGDRQDKTGFLIAISGARLRVLARCPTERTKFQTLGWVILITCGMATASMWFALTSAMGFDPVFSFPIAVLWGLIIMGIDRWMVTSMPLDGKRKFLVAAPRVALALLLGSLISTPIVLRIFESEINNQISIIKEQSEAAFLTSQQHSSIVARVSEWQTAVRNYQGVIDSKGAQPINSATDPEVEGLTKQLNSERKLAAADYHAWQCQLYGDCGSPQGSGPLALASEGRYKADESEIALLTSQINTRTRQLQAANAGSDSSRLQQAQAALPAATSELAAATAEQTSLTSNFQTTNSAANGLLIRLKALDQLSTGDATLQAVRILLFLLFLVIEVLPVTVKLLQQQGNYEKILRQEINKELAAASWELRGERESAGMFRPTGGTRAAKADGEPGDRQLNRRQPDLRDTELLAVWEQHARAASARDWDGADAAGFQQPVAEDATGPNGRDDVLRRLADTRSMNGYEEGHAGVERRYGEGDL